MKKLVIFGIDQQAELAYWYFTNDSDYEVVAFTVDKEFIENDKLFSLPIIPFEEITHKYPPSEYSAFVAIGYSKLNKVRKEKYTQLKNLNYVLPSYVSSSASILSNNIGDNCLILEENTIQPFVEIGNNVTLWSGNHIGHHSKIKDHCFIASHVVISGGVIIEEACFLGVNSTIRDHITIEKNNVIGAGAIIMSNTEQDAVYVPKRTDPRVTSSDKLKKI